jgi:predicted DNA-binding ribbon-helix-helix protein
MSKHSKSVAKVSAEFTGSGDLDAELAEAAEAAEVNPDAPLTDRSTVTRGHARSKVLQVRLNQDEFDAIEHLAERRQLPVSTIAREQLLKLIAADDDPTDRLAQLQSAATMLANFFAELRDVAESDVETLKMMVIASRHQDQGRRRTDPGGDRMN